MDTIRVYRESGYRKKLLRCRHVRQRFVSVRSAVRVRGATNNALALSVSRLSVDRDFCRISRTGRYAVG